MKKIKIIIDCGHGGINPNNGIYVTAPAKQYKHDKGSFHQGSTFWEGVYNRDLGDKLAKKLADLGIDYEFVSHEWLDVPLSERTAKANKICENKDYECLLISLHGNASGNADKAKRESAGGLSIFVYSNATKDKATNKWIPLPKEKQKDLTKDKEFANDLGKLLKNAKGTYVRTEVAREWYWIDDLHMVRKSKCPAIISEMGFFTNPKEAGLMMTPEFQDQVIDAHVQAIINYKVKYFSQNTNPNIVMATNAPKIESTQDLKVVLRFLISFGTTIKVSLEDGKIDGMESLQIMNALTQMIIQKPDYAKIPAQFKGLNANTSLELIKVISAELKLPNDRANAIVTKAIELLEKVLDLSNLLKTK